MRLKIAAALALALGVGTSAHAATNLITNGDFSQNTLPDATLMANNFSGAEVGPDYKYGQAVVGWTSSVGSGAAFNLYYFGNGSEKTEEADTQYGELGQHPNANYTGVSPNGGAFMILDGDPGFSGTLSQTVSGLSVGSEYQLSFYWAAGELADRTGYFTDQLTGSFGSDNFATSVFTNSHPYTNNPLNLPGDFSGWRLVTVNFTASATSEVLSFLSVGTPAGNLPPVSYLDGVSLVAVPEPAVWGLMLLGFGGLGAMIRRRRTAAASAEVAQPAARRSLSLRP